ncbi:MAG: DUF6504 family protein [Propioniciclava sp.]
MRRYDEPIEVRSRHVDGAVEPVQFLWRRKLWQVLSVETRWRETADWWAHPGDDLLAESEIWRVVAAASQSALPGVYELAHPVSGGAWLMRAVVD